MGKSSDKSSAKAAKAEPEAAKALDDKSAEIVGNTPQPEAGDVVAPPSMAADGTLPVVEAPKLDGGEAVEPSHVEVGNQAPIEAAAPRVQPRTSRFALLAAVIALAAAFGSFAGSFTASGLMRFLPAHEPSPHAADASVVLQAMKAQLAELSAVKSDVDGATRSVNTDFAKIADRLDRVERAEADPAAKLAQIADAVDRLDKRSVAAPETTGSITPGSPPASEPKETDKVLPDWIVQEVRRGRAMVENRYGSVFFVGPGSYLPRLGAVDEVKQQDGQWIVVTEHGTITSSGH